MGPGPNPSVPPLTTSRHGGRIRRALAIAIVVLAALGGYGFTQLGTFLDSEDPPTKADAIVVLAGSQMTRPLEGADLYLEGYAPRIVLTRETLEPAFAVIERRGAKLSSQVERSRDVLLNLGVPPNAIILPAKLHDSTAAEAITARQLAQANGWRTIIVVSSKFHLRRARFAMERELKGTGIQVRMRGSRYDDARPERWWRQRGDIRTILQEVPKLAAYVVGLGA
jgi:uncharacterized SAM-binding protein YcdF (DUF218 family)